MCVQNLARFKVPRDVVLVAALPRNATGKVIRRELADLIDIRGAGAD